MLQVEVIRDEKQRIVTGLRKRGWTAQQLKVIDLILTTDDQRRSTQKELNDIQAEGNRLSKSIGQLMGQGKKDEAEAQKEQVLLIYCPSLIFPFARRVIADVNRDGGFQPLMINPIDFASLYAQQKNQATAN